ncbi:RNA polymerase sigma factor [Dyadobacter sp. NIV53]|uniref:RNA polymerase sigma factor n=1 Tax=Dyadobacter sp. NIV53 TaxID=2861765 RepID=UPI001C878D24|nr:sigma-70 family RNA polymerase sigma factor [Dyadobacter sp. NIV53]
MNEAPFSQSQQDRQLISEVSEGKFNMLDQFYKTHKSGFLKWVYKSYGLSRSESEDIYQDAFEVLFKKITLGKLDNIQANLKSYLFSVGKYMIYNKFKKGKTVNLTSDQPENELNKLEDVQMLPLEADEEEQRLEVVVSCKRDLSRSCQSILDMFYAEKKSMKEIARLLGYKNEDVVKSQKVRCLSELRKCVEAQLKWS